MADMISPMRMAPEMEVSVTSDAEPKLYRAYRQSRRQPFLNAEEVKGAASYRYIAEPSTLYAQSTRASYAPSKGFNQLVKRTLAMQLLGRNYFRS